MDLEKGGACVGGGVLYQLHEGERAHADELDRLQVHELDMAHLHLAALDLERHALLRGERCDDYDQMRGQMREVQRRQTGAHVYSLYMVERAPAAARAAA